MHLQLIMCNKHLLCNVLLTQDVERLFAFGPSHVLQRPLLHHGCAADVPTSVIVQPR
jgi:hypothetical protein